MRTQGRDHERRAATALFARLGRESLFKSFTLTVNGRLTRNESIVEFTGDDAVAHVAGACVGDGDFHHDDTVFVTHDALGCESRQVFKKVLRGGAVGVFQGKILVKPGAQKTDGYQISQGLLLDEASQFLAKPELEIYADDVVCSHGSTSGAVDDDALFYLTSRGIPRRSAEELLVLAFLDQAIAEVEDARTGRRTARAAGGVARAPAAVIAMPSRGLVDTIARSWRAPRAVMADAVAAGLSEARGARAPDAGLRALLRGQPAAGGAQRGAA